MNSSFSRSASLTPTSAPVRNRRTIDTVYWDFDDFLINPESHEIIIGGDSRRDVVVIKMRRREFELFRYFYLNSGRIINKEELMERVWNYNLYITTNTLEVHLCSLRNRFRSITPRPVIETVHGAGYRFCL